MQGERRIKEEVGSGHSAGWNLEQVEGRGGSLGKVVTGAASNEKPLASGLAELLGCLQFLAGRQL